MEVDLTKIKIRKALEEELEGVLELQEGIIIWSYKPNSGWILYSDNFMELDERMGLLTEYVLKILAKADRKTAIKVKETTVEFSRWNSERRYRTKYSLAKFEREEDKKNTIERIEKDFSVKEKLVNYELPEELRKILTMEIQKTLVVNKKERIYFSDSEETMIIPTNQERKEQTNGVLRAEYDYLILEKVLQGIGGVKKVHMEIRKGGILKITLEIEGGVRFYVLMTKLEE